MPVWLVTQCSILVCGCFHIYGCQASHSFLVSWRRRQQFNPKCWYLPTYTASYSRRQTSSSASLWKFRKSNLILCGVFLPALPPRRWNNRSGVSANPCQDIRSCTPYLQAVSSVRNARTRLTGLSGNRLIFHFSVGGGSDIRHKAHTMNLVRNVQLPGLTQRFTVLRDIFPEEFFIRQSCFFNRKVIAITRLDINCYHAEHDHFILWL